MLKIDLLDLIFLIVIPSSTLIGIILSIVKLIFSISLSWWIVSIFFIPLLMSIVFSFYVCLSCFLYEVFKE